MELYWMKFLFAHLSGYHFGVDEHEYSYERTAQGLPIYIYIYTRA